MTLIWTPQQGYKEEKGVNFHSSEEKRCCKWGRAGKVEAGQTEKHQGHARGVINGRGQCDNNKVTELGQKVWTYPLDTTAAPQHRTFLRDWDPKTSPNELLSSTLSVSWVFKLCDCVRLSQHRVPQSELCHEFCCCCCCFFKKCLCYPSIIYKFDLYNRPSRSLSAHWTMTNWFWTITYLALLLSRRIYQCD